MIVLHFPWLPPSANHAYFDLPRGGRALSKKGKKFKTETAAHLTRNYPTELRFFQKNKPYGVYITFYIPDMYNKTWPEKAESRYKKADATNLVKLLEDVLSSVANTDDSQNLLVVSHKVHHTKAATKIIAWSMEEETLQDVFAYGFPRAM
jgi:Holliday junction resolvase RusA-like endonuclease